MIILGSCLQRDKLKTSLSSKRVVAAVADDVKEERSEMLARFKSFKIHVER